ncbi:TlpA disulfide reductase family protein [Treponema sp.]|uniref:TlpA family protein disulfide reductase n=1 Tax=Treponema sp. TaxID=166 RepID=UPI0025E86566|nr:TlpA disulfide reductase family protein [Treponema sp.]MBR4320896.1 TlpA family protein disulfide reductase [Treponema sp.]
MKKLLAIFVLMTVAVLTFAQKAGDKVSFSTKSLEGKEISDDMFAKNKVTMLNIWGTFCPPCIKEMPDLAKLNEANKEKGVKVAGIVIDLTDRNGNIIPQAKKDADTIIAKTGANYTHIVPSKDMMNGLLRNVQAVPTTIFVNSEGKIIGQIYMGARSQKDWQKIIDGLLNK